MFTASNTTEEREHKPKIKKPQQILNPINPPAVNPLATMSGNNGALPVRQHFLVNSSGENVPSSLQEFSSVSQIPANSTMKKRTLNPPSKKSQIEKPVTYSKFGNNFIDKKQNEPKMWDLDDEYKQKFLNKLDSYLETGIQLTPQYLQESFKRFINENPELSIHKIKFFKLNWFEILLDEHKNIASKLESPNFAIEHTINQLALVAHFSTLRFLYKHFFDSSQCAHPERIYVLDEYILRIPHYSSPCKIDVTRRDISEDDTCGSKIVTLAVGANTFGHKVPPVLILQGGGLRPSFKKNFPKDWRIVTSPTGRMTSYYFQFWVEHFASTKPAGRMILLLNHEMRKYLINPSPELLQVLENSEISIHFFHRLEKHELSPLGYDVFE